MPGTFARNFLPLLLALSAAAPAAAQEASGSLSLSSNAASADSSAGFLEKYPAEAGLLELGVFAGAIWVSQNHNLRDVQAEHYTIDRPTLELGLRAGYFPLSFLGAELEAAVGPMGKAGGESLTLWGARGQLVAQLPGYSVTPFALVGAGRLGVFSDQLKDDGDPTFHLGCGAKLAFSELLGVRLDLRDHFITQNPDDVPDSILAQLGNRVQHALRAFTARDQQALRKAAQTYRPNPRFSTEVAIREVGVGEAVTSFLENKGVPGMVERTLVRPPSSAMGPVDAPTRAQVIARSPVAGRYDRAIDRDSAHEMLARREAEAAREAGQATNDEQYARARRYQPPGAMTTRPTPAEPPRSRAPAARSSRSDSPVDAFTKSMARSIGTRAGSAIVRGVLGTLFRGR